MPVIYTYYKYIYILSTEQYLILIIRRTYLLLGSPVNWPKLSIIFIFICQTDFIWPDFKQREKKKSLEIRANLQTHTHTQADRQRSSFSLYSSTKTKLKRNIYCIYIYYIYMGIEFVFVFFCCEKINAMRPF